MLVENQMVDVNIVGKTINHYKALGYDPKAFSILTVRAEDLSPGSHCIVKVICDYCKKSYTKPYKGYLNQKGIVNKDSCLDCKAEKTKESMRLQFGVDNIFQLKEIQDKQRVTIKERYNVENISQLDKVKEKKKKTTLKNYGVTSPMRSDIIQERVKQACFDKYGVEHYTQTEEYKQRAKRTSLERYGTNYPMQSEIIKKKSKNGFIDTCGEDNIFKAKKFKDMMKEKNLKRFGVEFYCQTEEFKEKSKRTSLERYGYEYPMQNPKIRKRVIETNRIKYGVDHVFQSEEVRKKILATLAKNGIVKTSSQQLATYEIVATRYNDIELNYPMSRCILDIALFENDVQINIEYDGWYWHQDQQKDRRRDEYLKTQGWKILRIKSGYKLPTEEQLIESINKLLYTDRTYTQIVLDDWRGDAV